MNIKVIRNDKEFLSLKDDWDKLAQDLMPVNRFDWIYKWWKCLKADNNLNILVAENDGKILGIAPLFIKYINILKCINIKKLSFLGSGMSLYYDFLIQQDEARELVFQALLNYIVNSPSFDVLILNDINSHYPNFDLWQKYTVLLNLKLEAYIRCPKIRFSDYRYYDDYLKQLSRNHKHSLKFRQNRINKNNVNIEYVFKKHITKEDIEAIAKIHIKRQIFLYEKKVYGRFSDFIDEGKTNFIKEYFCSEDLDSKMLAYLKCDGIIASYYLMLLNKHTIYLWNTGFNADCEMYAPTKLLLNELIKYAFQNKYDSLDFGKGDESYKLKWANDVSVNYNLVKRKSLKAKLVYLCKDLIPEFLKPKKFRLKNIQTSVNSII